MSRDTEAQILNGCDYVGKPMKVAHNVYKFTRKEDGATVWRYHRTNIVIRHTDGTWELNAGGWHTKTTKANINGFSPARIYQKKGEWFLHDGTPFESRMRINAEGVQVLGAFVDAA